MQVRRQLQKVHIFLNTYSICTLNYLHPLMIVVIICGGKSHFHKVRFSSCILTITPSSYFYSLLSLPFFLLPVVSLRSSLSLPFFSLLSLCISPLFILHLLSHPHPPPPLLPVVGSSLSPTPSFAPRISSLLHGLASSLSLSPFIYINEQKSSFHLPPDEQTLLVEEDRRKEERNTEEHSFS